MIAKVRAFVLLLLRGGFSLVANLQPDPAEIDAGGITTDLQVSSAATRYAMLVTLRGSMSGTLTVSLLGTDDVELATGEIAGVSGNQVSLATDAVDVAAGHDLTVKLTSSEAFTPTFVHLMLAAL